MRLYRDSIICALIASCAANLVLDWVRITLLNNTSTSADLTIFVNTSDNFEDCWHPFFTLFHRYWPDCPYSIVLNTETKDFSFSGLNITCAKVSLNEPKRLGWSECLERALDSISTPYILYLQEDYFLESAVRAEVLNDLLALMRLEKADVIRLSEAVDAGPWHATGSKLIWTVDQKAKWRFSLQAALWRKDLLRAQIRKHESPWQLESYGGGRLRRSKEKICCVNRDLFSGKGKEVFPYTPTGIIAGKWVGEIVVPLFQAHDITMDFTKRGFHLQGKRSKKRKAFLLRAIDRVRSFL
jgi:hypothetical protein